VGEWLRSIGVAESNIYHKPVEESEKKEMLVASIAAETNTTEAEA
jgi:hypothetical protein